MEIDEVRLIGQQILEAVQQLHDIQVIHTDLKPENICLLDGRNEDSTCCSEQQ